MARRVTFSMSVIFFFLTKDAETDAFVLAALCTLLTLFKMHAYFCEMSNQTVAAARRVAMY